MKSIEIYISASGSLSDCFFRLVFRAVPLLADLCIEPLFTMFGRKVSKIYTSYFVLGINYYITIESPMEGLQQEKSPGIARKSLCGAGNTNLGKVIKILT